MHQFNASQQKKIEKEAQIFENKQHAINEIDNNELQI